MSKRRKRLAVLLALLVLAGGAFVIYTGHYYHAGPAAQAALASDADVSVTRTDYGWLFDGPSGEDALIFYPGAKVEAAAYAPLLHRLAQGGLDVCLVEMPFRLAFFGMNRAGAVMERYDYTRWYIGGHSLGGAMAAEYAAGHGGALDGLILCAAYPTKALEAPMLECSVYGSEDGVLNMEKVASGRAYAPPDTRELVIAGGNHAQFGDYGPQAGDGEAALSAEEQQRRAAAFILQCVG